MSDPSYPGATPNNGGGLAAPAYASWFKRVGSYVIDSLIAGIPQGLVWLIAGPELVEVPDTSATGTTLELDTVGPLFYIGMALVVILALWNVIWRQGKTGQSLGKQAMGTTCLREADMAPLGPLMQLLRQLCHVFDSILCGLGYLWPLWDSKRQTFADKIISSVVVEAGK